MDLNQLVTVERHEAGAEFQLVDPLTGEKEDVTFLVKGMDSKAWRLAQKRQRREFEAEDDVDIFDHEYLWPMIASVIVGWDKLEKDGEPWEWSEQNAQELCKNSPIVVNQVFSFVIDRSNFTGD